MAERETTLHGALRRAYRVATSRYRAHLAHLDLTARQATVILAIEDNPASGLAAVALAVGADQPTTSALVDRLVERGLLARETDPLDRRRTRLRLTPAASAVANDIRLSRAAMEQTLMEALGEMRARTLLNLLNELTDRLELADHGVIV